MDTQKYYYISNQQSQLGDKKLEKLGESIDLTPEDAEHHIRGGCALLSEEEWQSLGISDDERKKYEEPGKRINIPHEFTEKLKKGWTIASHNFIKANQIAAKKIAEAAKATARGTEVAAKDVAHGTEVAAKHTAHAVDVAAKDTAHEVEKPFEK